MRAIKEACYNLNDLNLSQNSLSGDIKNEHSLMFCESLCQFVESNRNLKHLNLERMCLQQRVKTIMWSIYRSASLQAVHLSDNDISSKILKSLLFVFGIPDANSGDLFDACGVKRICKLQSQRRQPKEVIVEITNAEILQQICEQKTHLLATNQSGVGRSPLNQQPLVLTRKLGHRELIFNESKVKSLNFD